MATLLKSEKSKMTDKIAGQYTSIKEASLAKNGVLIERFKKLNVKVVTKK